METADRGCDCMNVILSCRLCMLHEQRSCGVRLDHNPRRQRTFQAAPLRCISTSRESRRAPPCPPPLVPMAVDHTTRTSAVELTALATPFTLQSIARMHSVVAPGRRGSCSTRRCRRSGRLSPPGGCPPPLAACSRTCCSQSPPRAASANAVQRGPHWPAANHRPVSVETSARTARTEQ